DHGLRLAHRGIVGPAVRIAGAVFVIRVADESGSDVQGWHHRMSQRVDRAQRLRGQCTGVPAGRFGHCNLPSGASHHHNVASGKTGVWWHGFKPCSVLEDKSPRSNRSPLIPAQAGDQTFRQRFLLGPRFRGDERRGILSTTPTYAPGRVAHDRILLLRPRADRGHRGGCRAGVRPREHDAGRLAADLAKADATARPHAVRGHHRHHDRYLGDGALTRMVVLNRIYTRSGDDGTTALGTGERRKKYDLRIEAYGTLDEVNAVIAIARLHTADDQVLDAVLSRIQNDLFDVEADLCMPSEGGKGPGGAKLTVTDA